MKFSFLTLRLIFIFLIFIICVYFWIYRYRTQLIYVPLDNIQNSCAILSRLGAIVIPGVVSPDLCDQVASQLLNQDVHNPDKKTGDIYNSTNLPGTGARIDLFVNNEGLYADMYDRVMTKLSMLFQCYAPDFYLSEFSSFLVYPGATNQPWHSDTNRYDNEAAPMITVAIALTDIHDDLAPLQVMLGSHTSFLSMFLGPKLKMTCKKGDVIIWDSRIYHRGTANLTRSLVRPLFYFSLTSTHGKKPMGSTYSML